MPVQLTCPICNKQFTVTPSVAKTRRTCSRECSKKWMSVLHSGENGPGWQGLTVETKCAQCGAPLFLNKNRVENYANNFCNKTCYGAWLSENKRRENHHNWTGGGITLSCDYCGKEFRRIRAEAEYHTNNFCCKKCYSQWMSVNKVGPNSNNWTGGYKKYYGPNWIEQREKARERDKYTCQKCGLSEKVLQRKLDVHHIRPFRDFNYVPRENENYLQANDLSNLVSLCQSCHGKQPIRENSVPYEV